MTFIKKPISDRRTASFDKIKSLGAIFGFEFAHDEWKGVTKTHVFRNLATGKCHEWIPHQILRHNRFPKEAKTPEERLKTLSDKAMANGFKLLSDKWLGTNVKHSFVNTKNGDLYEGAPHNLLGPQGFPKEFMKKLRTPEDYLDKLASIAEMNGFKLLSDKWLGSDMKHNFVHTESGTSYSGKPSILLGPQGFPKQKFAVTDNRIVIAQKSMAMHFEQLTNLSAHALKNGFELQDTYWKGKSATYTFKCVKTRTCVEAKAHIVLSVQGFPLINGQRYLGEEVCRQAISHIFGGTFKTNSRRLKEIHGKNMQLDGYECFEKSPSLFLSIPTFKNVREIAFEFQGHQNHYTDEAVIKRDRLRAAYCKKLGILLIVIDRPPDWRFLRDSTYMYKYVCDAVSHSIGVEGDVAFKSGFKLNFSNWHPDIDNYEKLENFSKTRGFSVVDAAWQGGNKIHTFQHLMTGKEYKASPSSLYARGAFPKTIGSPLERHQELETFALTHGFKLLENAWLGAISDHRFLHVASGKIYVGKPTVLYADKKFPSDFRTPLDKYNALFEKAEEAGFILLETEWLGGLTKHRFHHIETKKMYMGVPAKLMYKKGFPKDLTSSADRYEKLFQFAQDNGFKLLEPIWKGGSVKHKFLHLRTECVYQMTPASILRLNTVPTRIAKEISKIEQPLSFSTSV